jgi:putative spermidine/putrescine transport system permease protein
MRMSAFQDTGAERIVAANPGTDLFPTRDMPFGWGFGKLPEALSNDGVLNWALGGIGLHAGIAYTNWAMWIVFSYVWLPFMVLPVYAALERIPDNYLEASGDLGAGGRRTFRSIVLPLALPGIVAGSIFTFSLTLGDYVTPLLVGGAGSSFIGNVVYENIGVNANVPFAAAFATVPVIVMAVYLLIARRLGAFEAF